MPLYIQVTLTTCYDLKYFPRGVVLVGVNYVYTQTFNLANKTNSVHYLFSVYLSISTCFILMI